MRFYQLDCSHYYKTTAFKAQRQTANTSKKDPKR